MSSFDITIQASTQASTHNSTQMQSMTSESFLTAITKAANKTTVTENGSLSLKSTLSPLLDFFSKSGALRENHKEALRLFMRVFYENRLFAKKLLFYCRDVRKGQGERSIFRYIINHLAKTYPAELEPNLRLIPKFGRWDDLYSLVNTPLQDSMFSLMFDQLMLDIDNYNNLQPISNLAKWLKSENTSSKQSRYLGYITRKSFNISSERYRKTLSILRAYLDIPETHLSQNTVHKINYETVPSVAMKRYHPTFIKKDKYRFTRYINAVVQGGSKKINASTLYPYEIVSKYIHEDLTAHHYYGNHHSFDGYDYLNNDEFMNPTSIEDITLETLWYNLPNYFDDGNGEGSNTNSDVYNVLPVIDVSGSMFQSRQRIKPIDVAVSLGLYMAERNKGVLKDHFMTFSTEPELVNIMGSTLRERVRSITSANWGYSTNLINVFELFIETVKRFNLPNSEVPKKVFIISDMQFDDAVRNTECESDDGYSVDEIDSMTTFEIIDKMFKDNGISRPTLVFWNVNAKSDSPVTKDENGVYLVSGVSPSILKHALNTRVTNPFDLMLEVINSERYKEVV